MDFVGSVVSPLELFWTGPFHFFLPPLALCALRLLDRLFPSRRRSAPTPVDPLLAARVGKAASTLRRRQLERHAVRLASTLTFSAARQRRDRTRSGPGAYCLKGSIHTNWNELAPSLDLSRPLSQKKASAASERPRPHR